MVKVKTPEGAAYCIDQTEVTMGQYNEFVQAVGTDPSQSAYANDQRCTVQNASFVPNQLGTPCTENYFVPKEMPNQPMGCVDVCDARAYCSWAGKHLCGRIGGGPTSEADAANSNASEWYNACSQGGAQQFAYGNEQNSAGCKSTKFNKAGTAPTPSITESPECASSSIVAEAPIFELSSGLGEWEDGSVVHPNIGEIGVGLIRGRESEPAGSCKSYGFNPNDLFAQVGFRCCAN